MKIMCAGCDAAIDLPDAVGFRDTCPSCDAWLHSCLNCRFLVNGQCIEPAAEKVRDPEGQNFCEWFAVSTQHAGRSTQQDKSAGSKEAAEEMWRRLTKK